MITRRFVVTVGSTTATVCVPLQVGLFCCGACTVASRADLAYSVQLTDLRLAYSMISGTSSLPRK